MCRLEDSHYVMGRVEGREGEGKRWQGALEVVEDVDLQMCNYIPTLSS